ncbi:hypothetical protein NGH88_12370 [Enterococcus faecalis]|uniref:hypothetical protein n=1 Tax=Enterococcus faecalis TaxID=1351 RepID=UPI002DBFD6A5|nr:hypothetical protein [Enterococcus faecalis]MEB7921882.1 hypothetical protein [Enterococcus faecalis]
MLTDFETFRKSLIDSGYKFFRDKAPSETAYPYLVYSYFAENCQGPHKNVGFGPLKM